MIGEYIVPQDRWFAVRVTGVDAADGEWLRVRGDRVDLDNERRPVERNVHHGYSYWLRRVAPGVLRERCGPWDSGFPKYWRVVLARRQLDLFA